MFLPSARAAQRGSRPLVLIAAVMAAIFILSFTSFAASANAASPSSSSNAATTFTAAAAAAAVARASSAKANTTPATARKKAVIVVGPVGSETAQYIKYAKAISTALKTSPDIDVTLILPPYATWNAVVANANGADFFAFLGHGNGWPSPMPPAQEETKNGLGLNPTYGDTNNNNTKYYGANYFHGGWRCSVGLPASLTKPECTTAKGLWKNYGDGITLAPNAIVLLNHLCYSAGNASPGMALPTQDVAFQRADNFASGFLAVGARAVVALGWQPGEDLAYALINEHMTMDGFFKWKDGEGSDPKYQPWHGYVGWKPNVYLDSVRTPGAVVHLDPHPTEGHLRAVTGDLGFTFDEWWGGADSDDTVAPTVTDLTAGPVGSTTPAEGELPVFTPNGDKLTDTLVVKHTLSEQAYLDVSIAKATDATVVRSFTSFSEAGATTDVWDGKNNNGNFVPDGAYTITVKPKDRAGNVGEAVTTGALALTAMRGLTAAPALLHASDGDLLAQSQTQTVTLDQPAELSWIIKGKNGLVRTVMTNESREAGLASFVWDGLDDLGAAVPDGLYTMVVTATTGKGTYSHELLTRVMPFKVTASKWSAPAGTSIKLTIVTAEAQKGWPTLYVKQPGLSKYRVSLIKYSTKKFTATFTLRAGAPGPVKLTLTGTDTGGGVDVRTYTINLL